MRILIATGIYPPDIGGPALHVKKLAEAMRNRGWEVKIITYGEKQSSEVVVISRRIPFGLRHLIYFWRCFWLSIGCDLIYAQDTTAAGLPAFLTAKFLGKKFFIRIGGDLLWERAVEGKKRFLSLNEYYKNSFHLTDWRLMFPLIKYILQHSKKVIVPADLLKRIYIDFYDVKPEKLEVILNPIVADGIFGAHNYNETILFAGRFVAYKNLKFLMKVFDKVRQEIKKGKLVLIGDGPEKGELKKFSDTLISRHYIEILPPISREELLKKINSVNICVGPALTEFNPNFILDCLSMGRVTLLSKENGLTIHLPEELLFDPKNENELAEKIKKLLRPEVHRDLSAKISKILLKRDWEEVAEENMKILCAS